MSALGNHICNFITFHNLSAPSFSFKVKVRVGKKSVAYLLCELYPSHKYKVLQINIITWNTIVTPTPLLVLLLSPESDKEKVSTGFCHIDGAGGPRRPLIF